MVKILVVEDNPALLGFAREMLGSEGFQVETAGTGEEGRRKVKDFQPDLLVLDLTLPDDFGLDICREMKQEHPGLIVFIMTALGNSEDVVAGLDAGADDYIPKPFNHREFMGRLKALLRRAGKI